MSTEERNKALVQRLYDEVWNIHGDEIPADLIAASFGSSEPSIQWRHFTMGDPGPSGLEALLLELNIYRAAFKELRFTVEHLVASGDLVFATWRVEGLHKTQTVRGRNGYHVARRVVSDGASVSRISDGKIASHKLFWEAAAGHNEFLEALRIQTAGV
jgi:hypothetical protein